ncbi:MAG: type I restriction endonuclease subunit R, partial [Synergistaceae bacterium]|nr:type I restriction endonuclease subunit R [Synergistaceae bacterium]
MSYNIIVSDDESTVVAEYTGQHVRSEAYQTEADLEREFIALLVEQGYEYISVHKEEDLIANLRAQIERLNGVSFSDGEWGRFLSEHIVNVKDKTDTIQRDHRKTFEFDDKHVGNIDLIDKEHVHNNRLQVINQYSEAGGARGARYDVTVLVNGLPLVHVELKRRGVDIREAFNQ